MNLPLIPLAATSVVLLAGQALAEGHVCPTGDDMEEGIILAQNDPFFMRGDFKSTPEGFVEMRIVDTGAQVQESMSLYRHGLVMTGEHTGSGHVEITYVDDMSPLLSLPDEGKVSISGIAKGPLGDAYVELELTFVGEGTATLGECSYDIWTVTSTLLDRSGVGASFRVDYAPELDLVVAARSLAADGTETPVYAYQWAGRAVDWMDQ